MPTREHRNKKLRLNQQICSQKKNQMITYISNPHSKTSKSQTKLKETNLFNVVLFDSTYSKTCN